MKLYYIKGTFRDLTRIQQTFQRLYGVDITAHPIGQHDLQFYFFVSKANDQYYLDFTSKPNFVTLYGQEVQIDHWRAVKGQRYYYLNDEFEIIFTDEEELGQDHRRYECGNYFKCVAAAEEAREKHLDLVADLHR